MNVTEEERELEWDHDEVPIEIDEDDDELRPRRRSSGRRARARRARRRRRLLATLATVFALTGVAAAGIWAATLFPGGDGRAPTTARPTGGLAVDRSAHSLVFATYDEAAPTDGASLVFVLAVDTELDEATLLFVPSATVADIPGHGLDRIGRAYAYGGAPLLDATLDNLLGVDFDGVIAVSEQGWSSLFNRIGGLTVDVPEQLVAREPDGSAQLRFESGPQHLDGPRLAELLTFEQDGEGDLARLPRAQRVLAAFLEALSEDPSRLEELFAGGAPMLDGPIDQPTLRSVIATAADAAQDDDLEVLTLPVSPLGAGQDGALRVDQERVAELVENRFANSIPEGGTGSGRELQILNGNGVPGIGQEVAERLVPAGFRVKLTDNADSFEHPTTLIIVYDDSERQLQIARRIRSLLGVGEIQISRTPQSVVDVTIVVGHDLLAVVPTEP